MTASWSPTGARWPSCSTTPLAADGATVARKALEAGVDMDMEGNLYGTTLAAQVRSGKIPEAVVDEAVGAFCASSSRLASSIIPTPSRGRRTRRRRSGARWRARWPTRPWCCSRTIRSRASERCCRMKAEGEEGGADRSHGGRPDRPAGRVVRPEQSERCHHAEGGAFAAAGRPAPLCARAAGCSQARMRMC